VGWVTNPRSSQSSQTQ